MGAEKVLRRNPKYVSILAPFTTCTLTMLCGTGHVVYTMLPIIYDIAIKNNIRPERPMAASSIASQMGILASPVSVAVVSLVAFLAKAPVDGHVIDFISVLSITIPVDAGGRADDRHLQLVPRQGPRQGRRLPGAASPIRKSARSSTAKRATLLGKTLVAQPVDGDVDLPRRDCGGGPAGRLPVAAPA